MLPCALRSTTAQRCGPLFAARAWNECPNGKGLGLSSPIPLYVVGIDASEKTVTVGPKDALERRTLAASGVNWIAGVAPASGTRVTAQIRYRHREAHATIEPLEGGRVHVTFDQPQSAVAPGQALVMYDGDAVVGGGWIE